MTVRQPDGSRRDVYLGIHNTPESRKRYNDELAKLNERSTQSSQLPGEPGRFDPAFTVDQLLREFWVHAERHYRDREGKPTTELKEIKLSLVPLRDLYAETPACTFGPRKLAEVRNRMIAAGWCRTLINRRMDRVKRAFKWAASRELVPETLYPSLLALTGLQKGRIDARESEPVKPVDPAVVVATLPKLNRHVRTMVELQQFTGMRPGEVCSLTLDQIDRTGEMWVYQPIQHKTTHRGKPRVIPLGPRSQALLTSFLVGNFAPPTGFEGIDLNQTADRQVAAAAYEEAGCLRDAELLRADGRSLAFVAGCVVDPGESVFSPAREREERYRLMRANRKSKVQPSQLKRRKAKPKRTPSARYDTGAYTHAIAVGAEKAGAQHWHPNQLRHTHATRVRKEFGLEAAGASLGHSKMSATEIYAERDFRLAARVASEIG